MAIKLHSGQEETQLGPTVCTCKEYLAYNLFCEMWNAAI